MIFRPLCIDYHSRAQEIVALEAVSRRSALRMLLPNNNIENNPSSNRTMEQRHCGDNGVDCLEKNVDSYDDGSDNNQQSGMEDEDVLRQANNNNTSISNNNNNNCDGKETTKARTSNNDDMDNSMTRIQSIMNMLGPAVQPSECAFRSIAPVTKGPVRGNILPIHTNNKPLEEITKHYSNNEENKQLNNVIQGLESGRSRFDNGSGSNNIFTVPMPDADDNELLQDTTFVDTMRIVFSNDNGKSPSHGSSRSNSLEKENCTINSSQKKIVWAQHVNNLPMPKSIYLKHEPEDEDLDKIYRLKSLRSSAIVGTSFASQVTRTLKCKPPQLGTLKRSSNRERMMGLESSNNRLVLKDPSKYCTKPKCDIMCGYDFSESRQKDDYALRMMNTTTVSFTKFLEDYEADTVS